MLTPEELAEAACDDQAWKQIERRAAGECGYGEIAKLPPSGPKAAGDQTEKRFGRDRLKRLVPFVLRRIMDENP